LKDKENDGAPKRFEDEDLKAIHDEDPWQSETQLAEALMLSSNDFKTIASN